MRLGVLGGTFDPIHNAHLAVAEEVRARLQLTEVLFVTAGHPQLKEGHAITPVEYRVEMVRLAIGGNRYFKLSAIEVERTGPSYTVDTITELRRQLATGDEVFFLMGWDNVSALPRWREPSRLITLCWLVAVPRPGHSAPDVKALESLIPGLSRRLVMLYKPEIDISSSEVRERVARGLSIGHLVPEPVEKYIHDNGLYRGAEGVKR